LFSVHLLLSVFSVISVVNPPLPLRLRGRDLREMAGAVTVPTSIYTLLLIFATCGANTDANLQNPGVSMETMGVGIFSADDSVSGLAARGTSLLFAGGRLI
jgi:hypothetical protein